MTMHLERGLTTLNTKKRKSNKKHTLKQIEKWTKEMRDYNKRMRQIHCHHMQMTIEQYIDYIHGRLKPKAKENTKTYKPSYDTTRSTKDIPSHISNEGFAPCIKKEPQQYTGDLIVGIATMHKSNAVPVMRGTKQAEEIAKMRR